MTRYAMAIDLEHCTGCRTCVVACQLHNALRPGVAWTKVEELEWGVWPDIGRAYLSHACLHCDEPLCVRVCPTGASHKREDGIVVVEDEICIGCGVCVTACQYGARTINTNDGWYYGAAGPAPYEAEGAQRTHVAEKCTFCAPRLAQGRTPACVDSCPVEIRFFGDLDDPGSAVSQYIRDTAAESVPGTAVYYAKGSLDLDLEHTITSACYVPVSAMLDAQEKTPPRANPVVLGVSGVVAAGAVTGLGLAVKRNVDRRVAADAPDDTVADHAADDTRGE